MSSSSHAWGAHGAHKVADKPRLNLALLGDVGAGRADLVRALATVGDRGGDGAVDVVVGRAGHRYVTIETAQRRYALAVSPLRMAGPDSGVEIFHDVVRGCHGADAAVVVMSCFDGVTEACREQLVAAGAFGVARAVGFIHARRGDDVDEATLELRHAMLDAGLPGDDSVMIAGDVDDARDRERLIGELADALDRSLPDVARGSDAAGDAGAFAFAPLDEVWGRAGSWDALARLVSGTLTEERPVTVADPVSGELAKTNISDLRSGHDGAPLTSAHAGDLVLFHVASPLEIDGDCQAVIAARSSVRLSSSLALDLIARPGHVLPTSPARLEPCELYVGHARVRAAAIRDRVVTLRKGDVVVGKPGMPALLAQDGIVIASGRVA